jgi:hypothetical protein
LANEAQAVANARSRAAEVAVRHPKRRPDSFRLTDATGKVFGVFPIYARGDDVHRWCAAIFHRWTATGWGRLGRQRQLRYFMTCGPARDGELRQSEPSLPMPAGLITSRKLSGALGSGIFRCH